MIRYTSTIDEGEKVIIRDSDNQIVSARTVIESMGKKRRVFAFDAAMGCGKTTLIKSLVAGLGSTDIANSPTFAIVNVYDIENGCIYHFDCYRLKGIDEARDFGAEDYLYSGNYCFIEWPEVIAPLLPEDTVWIRIVEQNNGSRLITIE